MLWAIDGLHSTQFNLSPSDQHVLVNIGSKILKKNNASAPKNPDGTAPFSLLGAYKLSTKSAELVWTLPDKPHFLTPAWSDSLARPRTLIRNGYVYFSTEGPDKADDRRFIIVKEDTGEVLVDVPRENDFWFQLIEVWSHGSRASFNLYSADPKNRLSGGNLTIL